MSVGQRLWAAFRHDIGRKLVALVLALFTWAMLEEAVLDDGGGQLPVKLVQSLDEAAAEALARKSGCLKCHGIDKKKDGPALKEIAAKYKGKADAEQKLITHVTTSPKVKIDDKEEEHEQLKTKDAGEIKNVVQWVLSR